MAEDLDPIHSSPAASPVLRMAIVGAGWAGLRQAEAAAELEALVRMQGESEHSHHQPLVGFGGVLGQGQVVGGVVVPVEIADLQFGADHRGFERHVRAWVKGRP